MMVAVVAAVIALVVGFVAGLVVRRHRRPEARETVPQTSPLTPAVIDVLRVLHSTVIVVDASDQVVWSAPTAGALGLVRASEVSHPAMLDLVREVRREAESREVELEVARGPLGGAHLALGVRVAPLSDRHVLLLIEDRTQAQRVEDIRRDFVVNVSHELKTPVSGLTLLAEAVDEARDDSEAVHRFAGRMQVETIRLGRLVQEIVQLSRLQVGDTLDDPVLVDVVGCAQDAVEHVRLLAEDKGIRILTSFAAQAKVYGDENLVTTAIRNLVENAVNYSDNDTQVSVTVRSDADLVSVVVKDQGSGIPAGELDRIFERFYRVDAARSRRTGGTGLGLAIVKHVCANHGGEVTVWSEEGQGSTFTMRLPAASPTTPAIPDTTRKVTP
ncbi:two-component system sensor histidine kinase SenX3 [Flexivirga oryzae]|uniref:Sensor-like histidine kinase SenX3 n=2 Tax=Flexivirga oryzae TaxID=1794944 RepID=A0A839NAY2_9MICO|nr:two-component system sensor histidine kinase SenX3 [Flexivirga oryzae]